MTLLHSRWPVLLLVSIVHHSIVLTFKCNKNIAWLILFNIVCFLAIINTFTATVKYLSRKPTVLQSLCTMELEPATFDEKKSVYIDYFDDDCGDWEGCYYYTIDIHNFVTHILIIAFGNPTIIPPK